MSMPPPRVPVTIVTGFLGSGKTTLLRHVLAQPGSERICVIVNEFGDIGLDHELLEASDDDVILLAKGCLCCTIRGSLGETLSDIVARQRAGRMSSFDRVVIETSGLADPTPILQLLTREPALVELYRLAGVVTVVDGVHGLAQLAEHVEARAQVVVADLVLISKTDLITPGALAALRLRIGALGAVAEVDTMCQGAIVATRLFALQQFRPRDAAGGSLDHDHADHASAYRHGSEIETLVVEFEAPVDSATLAGIEAALRVLAGPQLLRVKGILRIANETAAVVVQGVRDRLYPNAVLTGKRPASAPSCIVFIGAPSMRSRIAALFRPLGGKIDIP